MHVDMVNHVIKLLIELVESNISWGIETAHYFSDGCASQYKNFNQFINICHHEQDFATKCTWSLIATSHFLKVTKIESRF